MKSYIEKFFAFAKRKNLVPKLTSIILAVILWAYITNTRSGDLRFNIPVEFRNSDTSLVVSRVSQKSVVVRVSGRKDDLKNVNARDISLFVDLSKALPGEYSDYKVEYTRNEVPEGIDIRVIPSEVKVLVEKSATKEVRVIPKFSGTPAKGYHAGKVRVFPETITLKGAPSLLDRIDLLYTSDISLEGASEIISAEIPVDSVDTEGIDYSRSTVMVTVPVISYSDVAEFELPLVIQKAKKGYKYLLKTKAVKVHLMPDSKKKITDYSLSAVIDASLIKIDLEELERKGKIEREAEIDILSQISDIEDRIISITPDSVVVEITSE